MLLGDSHEVYYTYKGDIRNHSHESKPSHRPSRNRTLDKDVTWLRALICRLVLNVANQVMPMSNRSEVMRHIREIMVTERGLWVTDNNVEEGQLLHVQLRSRCISRASWTTTRPDYSLLLGSI